MKTIVLLYKNGVTETITTANPEKAKVLFKAESYVEIEQ